jgi:hypothetical protein
MSPLTYPHASDLAHTTKEAVASAILHLTYDRLRGAGPTGHVIYREKPSKVLHAQNLLPRRKPSATAASYLEKDDVTSPAHIGTVGLTFQIANRHDRSISVAVRACIYLRILPSTADLSASPVVFRLSKQARSVILRHRRDALRRAEEQNWAVLGDEGRKSPAWLEIKNRATEEAQNSALIELGITPASLDPAAKQDALVSILPEEDEAPAADDPAANDESHSDVGTSQENSQNEAAPDTAIDDAPASPDRNGPSRGDSDTLRTLEFIVSPGASNAPPEVLIEREHIPQKWLRLPVDLGALRIALSQKPAAIDRNIAEFNAAMLRHVEEAIDAWEKSDDPETGGLLWAFPAGSGVRSRMLAPPEVVARHLESESPRCAADDPASTRIREFGRPASPR